MRVLAAMVIVIGVATPATWGAAQQAGGGQGALTLDLVGVPLADALSTLARAAHVDLIVDGPMSGTVTLHLSRQTFPQALALLRDAFHLDIRTRGGTYVIRQLQGGPIKVEPPQATSDIVVRTYRLRYALASDVADELRALLGIAPARTGQQAMAIGQPPQAPQGGAASTAPSGPTAPLPGPSAGAAPAPGTPAPSGGGGGYAPAPQPPAETGPGGAPTSPQPGVGGQRTAGGAAVASDDRTNSVVVAAPFPLQLQVQEAILRLDRPDGDHEVSPLSGGAGVTGTPVMPRTYRYEVRYADPQAIASAIMAEIPGSSVLTDLRTNAILVTGPASVQRRTASLLRALDTPAVQILIQTEVLDISRNAAANLGIQWTWQPYTFQTSPGGGLTPIVATLQALVSRGDGKVLANPQVATQQGVQAQITVGQTLYVPVTTTANGVTTTSLTTINAGIVLLDTPRLNGTDITNALNVQVNSISGFTPQGYPNISQRSVSSVITVGDGQPILIGGLISDTTTKTLQKIPLLGDIPILGQLFQYTTTTEQYDNIVVILTPHLIGPRAAVPVGSDTH